jgi:hypothetical protein
MGSSHKWNRSTEFFFFHGELDDYEMRKGDEKGLRRQTGKQTIISQDPTYGLKKYVVRTSPD